MQSNNENGVDILITCKFCGKPITVSNKYGMFCEDLCSMDAEKQAYTELKNLLIDMGVMPPEYGSEEDEND